MREKWKVGPRGRWTIVRPVGRFWSSLRRTTAVYLRLRVCEVSTSLGTQVRLGAVMLLKRVPWLKLRSQNGQKTLWNADVL